LQKNLKLLGALYLLGAVKYKQWSWLHSYLAYFGVYMSVVGFYSCIGQGKEKTTEDGFGFKEVRPEPRGMLGRLRVSPLAFLASPLYKMITKKKKVRTGTMTTKDNYRREGENNGEEVK
jgi:hypothetical protein